MIFILSILFFLVIYKIGIYLSSSLSDLIIKSFALFVGIIIPSGYFLSSINEMGNPYLYLVFPLTLSLLIFYAIKRYSEKDPLNVSAQLVFVKSKVYNKWKEISLLQKSIFVLLILGVSITTIMNLVVLFITVPNEWDSMTGHLVKCAYYLQNGNMARVHDTTWSVDFYPNSLPTLQIFGYHIFGENGFKLIHFLSYWMFVITTGGIADNIFKSKTAKVYVWLFTALLPSALIQAVTTETDIVQSAYLGLLVYLLTSLYHKFDKKTLLLFALAVPVWMSHKVTFLLIGPAFFLVFVLVVFKHRKKWKQMRLPFGVFFIGLLIYVLPNGYYANIKEVGKFSLGALSAPAEVMKWHGVESYSTKDKVRNLKLNALRYSSDFIQLDGIRSSPWGKDLNESFRKIPNSLFNNFDLERNEFWVVAPFKTTGDEHYQFYKERPFWGVIGFVLVLFALFLILFNRKKIANKNLILVFIAAFVVHFLSLCFSAPYDPIKGRYFMNSAVWLLPLLGVFGLNFKNKVFLLASSALVVWSGISVIAHRSLYPWVGENAIFNVDRYEQMTVTRPEFTDAYRRFDDLVPKNAIVALGTQQEHEDYVYPLWGKNISRKMIPIHPFRSAVKPIPQEAEYLFYSEGVIPFQKGDIQLGEGDETNDTPVPESKFFLRKLK